MILAELQATGQRQAEMQTSLTCWMREGRESLANLQQSQAAMEAQMLQQTAAMREGKDSLAQLQQRLEKMEGKMQQQAEATDDLQDALEEKMDKSVDNLQDVLEDRLNEVQQQARESETKTLDTLGALDSKIDKLTLVQEQQTKMHTAQFMDLQKVTTKARGKINDCERELERLRVEYRTAIHQLRQELDGSFRNEMEKIRNNELASLAGRLKEMERGDNKQLTASISTMLQASEQVIREELDRVMTWERNLRKAEMSADKWDILLEQGQTIQTMEEEFKRSQNVQDVTLEDVRKELAVFAHRSDKSLADGQKKLNRSIQAMEKKFKRRQKDAESGLTEALGTRLESEMKELGTRLEALDVIGPHHARRREKVESLRSEVVKQGNELAAQMVTLDVQQSAIQKLLQDVAELRLAQEKGDSQIQAIRSASDQNISCLESKISIFARNDGLLRTKLARMETYLEDPVWRSVQEEIMRREYGEIRAREREKERRRQLALHQEQQFKLFETKMEEAVAKVQILQKKLIEQLGEVCDRFLPGYMSSRVAERFPGRGFPSAQCAEEWTESLPQEIFVKHFSSNINIHGSLGVYLHCKVAECHSSDAFDCCSRLEASHRELDDIIRAMKPDRRYYRFRSASQEYRNLLNNENVIVGGLERLRTRIDNCFNTSVQALAMLKYVINYRAPNTIGGDYADIISRELYKGCGATGPDWRPSNWILSQVGELPAGTTALRN